MNTDNLTVIGDDSSNSVVVLSVNGAPSLSASELRADLNRINSGAQLKRSIDRCPLRIAFSIQYTDFGVEPLYSELESLQSDLERSRHIKRVLMDIYQGSFNRPAARHQELGNYDRETFKIHLRLSSRDLGLESLYKDLTPYKTSFARNNFVRRKLFDAYNAVGSVLTAAQPSVAPAYPTPQPTFIKQEVAPQQTATFSVSDSSEKVTALRSKNVSMFNS